MAKMGYRNIRTFAGDPIIEEYPDIPVQIIDEDGVFIYYLGKNYELRYIIKKTLSINEIVNLHKTYTTIQPPTFEQDQIAVFDPKTKKWSIVEDYRGYTIYNINTKETTILKEIGSVPDGWTLQEPPTKYHVYNKKKKTWVFPKDNKILETYKQEVLNEISQKIASFINNHYPPIKQQSDKSDEYYHRIQLIDLGLTEQDIITTIKNIAKCVLNTQNNLDACIKNNLQDQQLYMHFEQLVKVYLRQLFVQENKEKYRQIRNNIIASKTYDEVEQIKDKIQLDLPDWFKKL